MSIRGVGTDQPSTCSAGISRPIPYWASRSQAESPLCERTPSPGSNQCNFEVTLLQRNFMYSFLTSMWLHSTDVNASRAVIWGIPAPQMGCSLSCDFELSRLKDRAAMGQSMLCIHMTGSSMYLQSYSQYTSLPCKKEHHFILIQVRLTLHRNIDEVWLCFNI